MRTTLLQEAFNGVALSAVTTGAVFAVIAATNQKARERLERGASHVGLDAFPVEFVCMLPAFTLFAARGLVAVVKETAHTVGQCRLFAKPQDPTAAPLLANAVTPTPAVLA